MAENQPSLEDMALEQVKLYARDLNELYRLERQRREELAEEKLVLEYRVRELRALNELFQSHLQQRLEVEEAYWGLLEELRELAEKLEGSAKAELKRIIARAESKALVRTQPMARPSRENGRA